LVDQLNAYNLPSDPLYYTTKFIDGLRSDIKSVVLIQHPRDLDTAYVLAQLQEEVAEASKQQDFKGSSHTFTKAPPTDDRPAVTVPKPPATDDKLAALYAYRKAKGLYYKCGLAYSRGHKCVDTVQLHLVYEIWQFLHLPEEEESPTTEPAEELHMLSLSLATTSAKDTPKTIRFLGHIGDIKILVLLDSGSSASFLSSRVAATLPEVRPLSPPVRVQVAGGAQLTFSEKLLDVTWYIGGFPFSSDLKVLPLSNYDLILSMDWLCAFSPMWIHWSAKCLIIPYLHSKIKLWGLGASSVHGQTLEVCLLDSLSGKEHDIVHHLPSKLQQLLSDYTDVFVIPQGLPPPRECDHQIQLVPGARPVQVRPYRYAPTLKTEIENQIAEMLQTGIIQPSTSAFSSPVILVKKKDNTYRFCVDYRHLNAMTVKPKFPVPVIDEFLDELHEAAWFSTLDLRAGFHQISMSSANQHKTAFQTHQGHYEFKVMPFGLSGAPATFQGVMNQTLAPLLRKSVLVFFDDFLIYSPTWSHHLSHLESVFQMLRGISLSAAQARQVAD
jgi:hypothetical protein